MPETAFSISSAVERASAASALEAPVGSASNFCSAASTAGAPGGGVGGGARLRTLPAAGPLAGLSVAAYAPARSAR